MVYEMNIVSQKILKNNIHLKLCFFFVLKWTQSSIEKVKGHWPLFGPVFFYEFSKILKRISQLIWSFKKIERLSLKNFQNLNLDMNLMIFFDRSSGYTTIMHFFKKTYFERFVWTETVLLTCSKLLCKITRFSKHFRMF